MFVIPSQQEGLQGLFQEDVEEDQQETALNSTGDSCFFVRRFIRVERDFMLIWL